MTFTVLFPDNFIPAVQEIWKKSTFAEVYGRKI